MLVPLLDTPGVQHRDLDQVFSPKQHLLLTRTTLFLRMSLIMDYLDCPVPTLSRRKEP